MAKQMLIIAKDLLMADNSFHKDISNQFKSLSRQVSKPNNTKNISKGLNNLSKSFNKMPKASTMDNEDIVTALTEIAQELLKGE